MVTKSASHASRSTRFQRRARRFSASDSRAKRSSSSRVQVALPGGEVRPVGVEVDSVVRSVIVHGDFSSSDDAETSVVEEESAHMPTKAPMNVRFK